MPTQKESDEAVIKLQQWLLSCPNKASAMRALPTSLRGEADKPKSFNKVLELLLSLEQLFTPSVKPTFCVDAYLPDANLIKPDPKSELRLYITDKDVCIAFENLKLKRKGIAPSREPNENYDGGASANLFGPGSGRISMS